DDQRPLPGVVAEALPALGQVEDLERLSVRGVAGPLEALRQDVLLGGGDAHPLADLIELEAEAVVRRRVAADLASVRAEGVEVADAVQQPPVAVLEVGLDLSQASCAPLHLGVLVAQLVDRLAQPDELALADDVLLVDFAGLVHVPDLLVRQSGQVAVQSRDSVVDGVEPLREVVEGGAVGQDVGEVPLHAAEPRRDRAVEVLPEGATGQPPPARQAARDAVAYIGEAAVEGAAQFSLEVVGEPLGALSTGLVAEPAGLAWDVAPVETCDEIDAADRLRHRVPFRLAHCRPEGG